ncbi:MAG: hypothetical protein HF982_01790 [Desulfobacteraceae bacterium]|nr:hypothetical protein [Desulfobacteraceae bacterium]MBC2718325.1 hypothetical protein [Desulfobacteraceae bacterium]
MHSWGSYFVHVPNNVYGIMNVAESMLLLGVKVKEFEKYEASKNEILET